jgi:hypothetical protein
MALEIAGNRRNFAILALKPDRRKCPFNCYGPAWQPFSPESIRAVRFQRLHVANAMRSEIDDVAKATLTFVCRQAFISVNLRNFPEADLSLLIAVSLHQITRMADKPETISRTHFK